MKDVLRPAPEEIAYKEIVDEIFERKSANPGKLGPEIVDRAVFAGLNLFKLQKRELADNLIATLKDPTKDTDTVWDDAYTERELGHMISDFEINHDPTMFSRIAYDMGDRFTGLGETKQAMFWFVVSFSCKYATPAKRN